MPLDKDIAVLIPSLTREGIIVFSGETIKGQLIISDKAESGKQASNVKELHITFTVLLRDHENKSVSVGNEIAIDDKTRTIKGITKNRTHAIYRLV